MPRYAWYGDDFTGATDTLACVAEAGQRTLLFPRIPTPAQLAAAGPLDAIGIAGATRAMASAAIAAELEPVGRFFAGFGVRIMHYKCCSTFDSAPEIGSIGAAIATLRPWFRHPLVPVVGGQPNLGRFCLFSTLFASAGSGGVVHRIDRHPTMAHHPVTPMHEADLRRHLAAQGVGEVSAIHYPIYDHGADALDAALDRLIDDAPVALLDVARAADLDLLGPALWRQAERAPMVAVGPSSVAQALMPRTPSLDQAAFTGSTGPVFVLVGSLSPVARAQAAAATSYLHVEASAAQLIEQPDSLLDNICAPLSAGRAVLLKTALPERATAGEAALVARASAKFVSMVLRRIPLRRVGIAGGDTSSHTAQALDIWALAYRRTLAPGVTLCETRSEQSGLDGCELVLKGGQMGPVDLFQTLLHGSP